MEKEGKKCEHGNEGTCLSCYENQRVSSLIPRKETVQDGVQVAVQDGKSNSSEIPNGSNDHFPHAQTMVRKDGNGGMEERFDDLKQEYYQYQHDNGDTSAPRGYHVTDAEWWIDKLASEIRLAEERLVARVKDGVRGVEQQYEHECYTKESRDGFNGCIRHIEWEINEIEKEVKGIVSIAKGEGND